MAPYQFWLDNGIKTFSLQVNFLRPSIYDLKTDENDPSFLSTAQKATHHVPTLAFSNTRNLKITFLRTINTPHLSL